jgi:hypothetical protein
MPSIKFAAWMTVIFSGAGLPLGCAVCAMAVVTRIEADSRITHITVLRLNIEVS